MMSAPKPNRIEAVNVLRTPNDKPPEEWRVEAIIEDGAIELTLFSGPHAEKRAEDYARWRYGRFTKR